MTIINRISVFELPSVSKGGAINVMCGSSLGQIEPKSKAKVATQCKQSASVLAMETDRQQAYLL